MTAREARTVIVITGSHTITAGYGIHEILKRPSISLTARVGLPRSAASGSSTSSPLDYTQYLVGSALDEAEHRGDDIAIFWPIRKGYVRDWQQMIALWNYILFHLLPIRRSHNDSNVLISLPLPISRATHAHLTQIFFEHFNSAAITIAEKPLLSCYGVGTMNACVVDLGYESCDITPVIECVVHSNANVKTDIGARHCILYLAHLLRRDQSLVKAIQTLLRYTRKVSSTSSRQSDEAALKNAMFSLAQQLVEEGLVVDEEAVKKGAGGIASAVDGEDDEGNFDIAAVLVEGTKKHDEEEEERRRAIEAHQGEEIDEAILASITGEDGQAGGSTDEKAVLVHFRGLKLKVGPERFRFIEPLFRPEILKDVAGAAELQIGDEPFGAGPILTEANDAEAHSIESHDSYPTPTESPDWSQAIALPLGIANAISRIEDADRRPQLWENLVFTGQPAKIKTIQFEAISSLSDFVATEPTEAAQVLAEPNPLQARNVRALKVPDYFSEFKDRNDLAPFLGGTIFAKLIFGDPQAKAFITKQNYNEVGPNQAFAVKLGG
ncbi:related to macronuclear actin 1 [Melanopsichium pennsylvanicum]|uniref:Related to macronuclear actin 1 n=2 Tax=Melanopsichium pennsylvanicum TaxID=63383 RepID=A0AAJ4XQD1_9BASI|nr:related to macronuclear actin 1 [Melanopsichium pennsylvanicum 4]SNX86388.1 related to macronuclear actin 1 [Melanopsichium pennsylvanicum]